MKRILYSAAAGNISWPAQSGEQAAKNCNAEDGKHDGEPASVAVLIQRM